MTGVNYLAEWQIEFVAKNIYYEHQALWQGQLGDVREWDDLERKQRNRYKDLARTAIGALDELGFV